MNFRLRYRLSLTERCTWLLFALLLGITLRSHAQHEAPVNLSNNPSRPLRELTPEEKEWAEEEPARNHGTGIRAGVVLSAARTSVGAHRLPAIAEVGAFHQRAFGRAGSVQVEALYFRQSTAAATTTSGLRLPLLLVVNPFTNVSVHLGPQLQWAWGATAPTETTRQAPSPLSMGVVVGGEARVERLRVGLRYGASLADLSDLSAAGNAARAAWKTGQVQVYLGMGFGKKA